MTRLRDSLTPLRPVPAALLFGLLVSTGTLRAQEPPAGAPPEPEPAADAPLNYVVGSVHLAAGEAGCMQRREVMIAYYAPGDSYGKEQLIYADLGERALDNGLCANLHAAAATLNLKGRRGRKAANATDNPALYYEGRTFLMTGEELAKFKAEHPDYRDNIMQCSLFFTDLDGVHYAIQLFSRGRYSVTYRTEVDGKPVERELGVLNPADSEVLERAFTSSASDRDQLCGTR